MEKRETERAKEAVFSRLADKRARQEKHGKHDSLAGTFQLTSAVVDASLPMHADA